MTPFLHLIYKLQMLSYSINIQYPGAFLDLLDDNTARDVYMLISTMEGQLNDAALVLSCYQREKNKFIKKIQAQSEADNKRIHHHSQFTHIYANYFVYALAIFGNCLNAIANDYDLPSNVYQIRDNFKEESLTLWDIRNSLIHIEDRARTLGRPDKKGEKAKMQLKGNLLVLGALLIDKDGLECTIADGSLQRIEISKATLKIAEGTLQNLINSLPWRGLPHGYLTDRAFQRLIKSITKIAK